MPNAHHRCLDGRAGRALALDPGPAVCGVVVYDAGRVLDASQTPTDTVLSMLRMVEVADYDWLLCESVEAYGMTVGRDVFNTVRLIGRICEAWARTTGRPALLMPRREVKLTLCGNVRAKDKNVRQALIDSYGGKAAAVGLKRTPGPLYRVKGHAWSALAVACAWGLGAEVEVVR